MALSRYMVLNTGARMPAVGLGTYLSEKAQCQEAVAFALGLGYRHIDTAVSYQNADDIGAVLQSLQNSGQLKREDVFLTTKLPTPYMGRQNAKLCIEESLEKLKTKYVDMFLIHKPWGTKFKGWGNVRHAHECYHHDLLETWAAMEEVFHLGYAKAIGVSNFSISHIDRILSNAKIKPANLQSECHAYLQQNALRAYCHQKEIAFTSYASIGGPLLYGGTRLLEDPIVVEIAAGYKKTPAQILLRFLVQQGIIVIPKSVTSQRITENIAIFDFKLDDKDIGRIRQLDRNVRYYPFTWAQNHPEYFPEF